MATLQFCSELDEVWPEMHALLTLTERHWYICKHPRQDPFQQPPLLNKDSYSTVYIVTL